MKTSIPLMLSTGLILLAASCAPKIQLLNPEMKQTIAAGHVKTMKLYVDADGKVTKRTLYVTADAIPSWVITLADEKIGKGAEKNYELEWYAKAPNLRVYEVTRIIGGKKVEVSVDENRQLQYIERQIDRSSLPSAVNTAVGSLAGFKPSEFEQKKGPGIEEYEVEGLLKGKEISYTFGPDGTLLGKSMVVMTEVGVAAP